MVECISAFQSLLRHAVGALPPFSERGVKTCTHVVYYPVSYPTTSILSVIYVDRSNLSRDWQYKPENTQKAAATAEAQSLWEICPWQDVGVWTHSHDVICGVIWNEAIVGGWSGHCCNMEWPLLHASALDRVVSRDAAPCPS